MLPFILAAIVLAPLLLLAFAAAAGRADARADEHARILGIGGTELPHDAVSQ